MSAPGRLRLLTVREAAQHLSSSVNTVYGLCAARKLRHVRVGVGRGKILIPEEAVQAYLEGRTVEAAGPAPKPAPRYRPVNFN